MITIKGVWHSSVLHSLFSCYLMEISLPFYFLVQDHAICCIFCSEGVTTILYAEHQERSCAIVANRAATCWNYSYYAALAYREYLVIYLELTLATEEEVKFLMVLVGMEETCLCARSKTLE